MTCGEVFESGGVGLFVGYEFDCAIAAERINDEFGEVFDGDGLIVSDVEHVAVAFFEVEQFGKHANDVTDIAEAANLRAVAVDAKWFVGQCGFDEAWEDHAVVSDLARSDGVEESGDDGGKPVLVPVGESEIFIEGFGAGVGPAGEGGRAVDDILPF